MPRNLWFLLLPQFSMLGFLSALEPLRVANRFRPGSYRWHILSRDGDALLASNGMSLNVDGPLQLPEPGDFLFVVAGFQPLAGFDGRLASWLKRAGSIAVLGGIDTGSFLLAEAGLLEGHRVALHWEAMDSFQERYPGLSVVQELFQYQGDRISCAGGTASIDLMLELITRDHGGELAVQVSEQFVLGRIRSRQDHQRLRIGSRYGIHNKKLIQAIAAMQSACEAPSRAALARAVGVSSRQLERLFRRYLGQTPSAFHLRLRLEKARQLLRQSDLGVLEVGLACGFESASYFSRCYRTQFGVSPSHDRQG